MNQGSNKLAVLAIAMVAMHLSGCTRNEAEPTEANLLDAFARAPDVCATRFPLPLEVPESERATAAKYPTMAPGRGPILLEAGLLEKTTVKREVRKYLGGSFMIEVDRYSLSEAAKPFFKPNGDVVGVDGKNHQQGRLCFAMRRVTAIKQIEPVGKVNLRDAVKVAYTYELAEVAEFAKSAAVQRALPSIGRAMEQSDGKTICRAVMTLVDGRWQAGRTPDSISECLVDH